MVTKTFYAIFDVDKKLFKGRGNMSGVRWTEYPTQTYDRETRANAALKAHLRAYHSWKGNPPKNIVVIPVLVSWDEGSVFSVE